MMHVFDFSLCSQSKFFHQLNPDFALLKVLPPHLTFVEKQVFMNCRQEMPIVVDFLLITVWCGCRLKGLACLLGYYFCQQTTHVFYQFFHQDCSVNEPSFHSCESCSICMGYCLSTWKGYLSTTYILIPGHVIYSLSSSIANLLEIYFLFPQLLQLLSSFLPLSCLRT